MRVHASSLRGMRERARGGQADAKRAKRGIEGRGEEDEAEEREEGVG